MEDDTRPETLVGGPLDGHEIDVRRSERECWPGPHHLREVGLTHGVCYRRDHEGRLRYDPTRKGLPVPPPGAG
jgi:hypothetical protein